MLASFPVGMSGVRGPKIMVEPGFSDVVDVQVVAGFGDVDASGVLARVCVVESKWRGIRSDHYGTWAMLSVIEAGDASAVRSVALGADGAAVRSWNRCVAVL